MLATRARVCYSVIIAAATALASISYVHWRTTGFHKLTAEDEQAAGQLLADRELREDQARYLGELDDLIGARPASLGHWFLAEGLALGAYPPRSEYNARVVYKLDAAGRVLAVEVQTSPPDPADYFVPLGPRIDLAMARIPQPPPAAFDPERCALLEARLRATWGAPTFEHTWIDPRAHQRATLIGRCGIRFERDLPVADWFAQLPRSASRLRTGRWYGLPSFARASEIELERVASPPRIRVRGNADLGSSRALVAEIETAVGKPAECERRGLNGQLCTWQGRNRIVLWFDARRFLLLLR